MWCLGANTNRLRLRPRTKLRRRRHDLPMSLPRQRRSQRMRDDHQWDRIQRVIDLHVVEAQSKQPLAGVEINASRQGRRLPAAQTKKALPSSTSRERSAHLLVTVHKDGFVRCGWIGAHRSEYLKFRRNSRLRSNCHSIGGIIRNEQGQPIAGASVLSTVLSDSSTGGATENATVDLWQYKVLTDEQGRWRLAQAPADLRTLQIELKHPDYVSDSYPGTQQCRIAG